jgi:hypothetical protein
MAVPGGGGNDRAPERAGLAGGRRGDQAGAMTQMQPEAPGNGLVENEGVNAGSRDQMQDEGGAGGDVLGGGRPDQADDAVVDYGDETLQAGELAGTAGPAGTDIGQDQGESGQDSGLMDEG